MERDTLSVEEELLQRDFNKLSDENIRLQKRIEGLEQDLKANATLVRLDVYKELVDRLLNHISEGRRF